MKVAVAGLGAIGEAIARALGPALCGVADLRTDAPDLGVPRWRDVASLVRRAGADAVVLCTASRVPQVAPSCVAALEAGLHVVSTSEELVWPWLRHGAEARALDARARAHGRVVLGVGVNPGFVMDRLPVAVAAASHAPRGVEVERVVDLETRRDALRRKLGAGLDEAAWRAAAARGELGHVGLGESAALLAFGLGWEAGEVRETAAPVLDGTRALGCEQQAEAAGGRVRLRLHMALGARDPGDRVVIDGEPRMELRIPGGVQGEGGTVATVLQALAHLARLAPGLRTVLDLPIGFPRGRR